MYCMDAVKLVTVFGNNLSLPLPTTSNGLSNNNECLFITLLTK